LPSDAPVSVTSAKSPTLTLLVNNVVQGTVSLPRGREYHLCASNEVATAAAPCDPGVTATNRLGVNITDQVYVCPPDACFLKGTSCAGHELQKKGLRGCVDSNLTVGSFIKINFVVYDKFAEQPRATATRYIAITSPCSNHVDIYCSADNSCGSDPCDARALLRTFTNSTTSGVRQSPLLLLVDGGNSSVKAPAASLTVATLTASIIASSLLNGSGLLYDKQQQLTLPYGRPAPYSLLPCSDLHNLTGCGALAVDA
ncbi:hypothetical protein Agub_g6764, partial [Astrephomene gubernaculifera]